VSTAAPVAGRRLDEFLPRWHYNEVHATSVAASPARVMRAIREVTPSEIAFFRLLMALRGLGFRKGAAAATSRPLLEGALRRGFLVLAEDADRELVLGVAGRFWRPSGQTVPVASPQEFLEFDRPGCAKAAIDFRIEEARGGRTRVTTETRILGIDAHARRRFGFYWSIVHPGSAFIRRMWLAAIKKRAESARDGRS
jgi:hypothetical protein